MSMHARLMRRKKWYTLEDAARRLSIELEEQATARDVLQLALDGDVSLCVILHSQAAKRIDYVQDRIDTRLFITFDGIDMEPAPIVANGGAVTVDENSFRYLDGIFALSNASGSLGRMLSMKVMESPDNGLYGGFLAVREIGGEGREWLIFENGDDDAPTRTWPDDSSLMVLRSDIDAFIASIEVPEKTSRLDTEGEELRALEALGLLAVTFAEGRKQYTHERTGKPNCAQIAKAMNPHAVDVYGMGESKLQRLLSDALAAWEERRS